MKIDRHPFPTNMVDSVRKKNAIQTKQLTSQSAEEAKAQDPMIVDQDNEGSKTTKKKVSWADMAEEVEGSLRPP